MKYLFSLIILAIFSCQHEKKSPAVTSYMGIPLLIRKDEYFKILGDLLKNDPSCNMWIGEDQIPYFSRKDAYGQNYYEFFVAGFNKGIVTQLTVYFSPVSSGEVVLALAKYKQIIYPSWKGSKTWQIQVLDDSYSKLKAKYGSNPITEYGGPFDREQGTITNTSTWNTDSLTVIRTFQQPRDDSRNQKLYSLRLDYLIPGKYFKKYAKYLRKEKTSSPY